jgi:hypothetical protein
MAVSRNNTDEGITMKCYLNEIQYASIARTVHMCQGREHWWDLANKAPKHIQIKKHRNTDVHVVLHLCEIWHLILEEQGKSSPVTGPDDCGIRRG